MLAKQQTDGEDKRRIEIAKKKSDIDIRSIAKVLLFILL